MGQRPAVIVPAHDEEHALGRTLRVLLAGAADDELDVVVVCNGCTDGTERVARAFEPTVRVRATATASKVAALNLGDEAVEGFPRIYLDADVDLDIEAVRAIVAVLAHGALLATPSLRLDVSGSSALVRSYHRIWTQLPSIRHDSVGRGVYAVSADGRARWGAFPNVLGDDHFVRSLFRSDEVSVTDVSSVVRAPQTARAVVLRKARVVRGNREVDRALGAAAQARTTGWRGVMAVLRSSPARIVDLPAYAGITVAARVVARRRQSGWGRDPTTRRPSDEASLQDVT